MREGTKVGLTFGILLVLMMLAVERIGWRRVAVIWGLLFAGSLVIKLFRLVFP
jgi:hypothetical protein